MFGVAAAAWYMPLAGKSFLCCRSLSSKVVSQYSNLLSPMAVDSVLKVLDPQRTS